MTVDTGLPLSEIAGFLGVALYLGFYAALQVGLVSGVGYLYPGANFLAAACVLYSLSGDWNLWAAIIQVSFMAISLFGMLRMFFLTRHLRFSPEEHRFLEMKFPDLPLLSARRFLSAGLWLEGIAGACLAEEGKEIGQLFYLPDGKAEIMVGDKLVARARPGFLVGELSAFAGGPASATVILKEATRYFSISTRALQGLMEKDPDFRLHFERSLVQDAHNKLRMVTDRVVQGA